MRAVIVALLLCFFNSTASSAELKKHIDHVCRYERNKCVDYSVLVSAVEIASTIHDIPSSLILAVIEVESKFRKHASNVGNIGLMQVLLKYHRSKFNGSSYYNPFSNIDVGTSILKDCINRRKTLDGALKCYNGGADPRYAEKVRKAMYNIQSRVNPTE